MRSYIFSVLAVYGILSMVLFGSVLTPIEYVTYSSDRLGLPYWRLFVVASAALAVFGCLCSVRLVPAIGPPVLVGLWLGIWMVLSVVAVGNYAERERRQKVAEFSPDSYVESSFFRSMKEAPRELQFFLHAGALKNCKPYAWSYSRMEFYPLPSNAAINVLPKEWLTRCGIKLER